MKLIFWLILTVVLGCIYSYQNMGGSNSSNSAPPQSLLGGFSEVNAASNSNDEGLESARKAVADKLKEQMGRPVKVSIITAQSQVVAGTNYRLKIKADDSHVDTKYYDAQVWAKLPAHGGAVEVTKLEKISATAAGVVNTEGGNDPEVDAAASYAVQQLSQQSNSLFPFQLKKVISATKTPGSNGDKEGVTHHMRLRVAQGSMPDQEFEVDVVEAPHGHVLKSSKLMV